MFEFESYPLKGSRGDGLLKKISFFVHEQNIYLFEALQKCNVKV